MARQHGRRQTRLCSHRRQLCTRAGKRGQLAPCAPQLRKVAAARRRRCHAKPAEALPAKQRTAVQPAPSRTAGSRHIGRGPTCAMDAVWMARGGGDAELAAPPRERPRPAARTRAADVTASKARRRPCAMSAAGATPMSTSMSVEPTEAQEARACCRIACISAPCRLRRASASHRAAARLHVRGSRCRSHGSRASRVASAGARPMHLL